MTIAPAVINLVAVAVLLTYVQTLDSLADAAAVLAGYKPRPDTGSGATRPSRARHVGALTLSPVSP